MRNRWLELMGASVIMLACTAVSGPHNPIPAPTTTDNNPAIDKKNPSSWIIIPSDVPYSYNSHVTAYVKLENGEQDSLTADTNFTLAVNQKSQPFSFTVTITALSVERDQQLNGLSDSPNDALETKTLPFFFSGYLENGIFSLDSPFVLTTLTTNCRNQLFSSVRTIERSIIIIPVRLQEGSVWTDSSSAIVCSGFIPSTLKTVQTYRVLGELTVNGSKEILLERRDHTVSTGDGTHGQHQVHITEEGTGVGRLRIDAHTGVLIASLESHSSVITTVSSGRISRFNQTAKEVVRLLSKTTSQ